jgi:hypothetical protein
MTAADYKVTFPYLATSAPYSITHPHSGEDHKMPLRTEIWVGDTLIAYSGNTGESTGPHSHVQRAKKGVYVAPYLPPQGKGYGNTIALPATVIEVGNKADVGNYVRLMDKNNERWSYFHNDAIVVKVGAVINEENEDMLNEGDVKNLYNAGWHRDATAAEIKQWVGKPMKDFFYASGKNQYEWLWETINTKPTADDLAQKAQDYDVLAGALKKALQ